MDDSQKITLLKNAIIRLARLIDNQIRYHEGHYYEDEFREYLKDF